jgi:hypothetical protein
MSLELPMDVCRCQGDQCPKAKECRRTETTEGQDYWWSDFDTIQADGICPHFIPEAGAA